MKDKKFLIIVLILLAIIIGMGVFLGTKVMHLKNTKNSAQENHEEQAQVEEKKVEEPVEKVDIVDVNSKDRPFAIVVNNTPVAVKMQTGLNKAYMVYEIPTEGGTSRLMALFKDIDENLTVGTTRSARHNFVDYALESDAIFVCYGWSHYAQDDLEKKHSIDFIQGLYGGPFWRNNPEKLALEHTAFTSIEKLRETVKDRKIRSTSENGEKTVVLNYNVGDVDISEKEGAEIANKISIPYGTGFKTEFEYDEENKQYNRIENGSPNIDYNTKEQFTAKNIIVQKINHSVASDGKYWNLNTQGSGEGYFITNGYAMPIKWSKSSRSAKTKYTYLDGTEIEVSDGRTYVEIQSTSQKLTIE